MAGTILKVKDISSGYDQRLVLRGLNFRVNEGEIIGVIGPNGSGKTTLIRTLTRILPLRSGSITFKDRDVYQMTCQELAREVAVVSQANSSMFFQAKVEEVVLLGRIPHFRPFQLMEDREDRRIVEEVMKLTDILELRERDLSEVSGGERQRVFIARALAQKPKLLLLDEPTAHLDINHRVEIFKLIQRLAEKNGFTVISVLHDLNLASRFCQRLLLLDKGAMAAQGSPEEVINKINIREIYGAEVNIYQGEMSEKPQILY